ncbi:transposase, partial [Clostridium polyendosporum]|uniref:transposase n=1 Tax=Clostridium polyendosporum TaxID=69208 RepID=UPI001BB325AB
LVKKAKTLFGSVQLSKHFMPLKIIDSTVILVALKLAPHLQIDDEKAAIKISTMFNGEYPEKVNIVKGKINDRKCIDNMFEDKNSIYVFDRGYYDYRWYDKLNEAGIKFVTRGLKNAAVMEERIIDAEPTNDVYDTEVIMGSTPSGNLTFSSYREIMTFDENGE